MIPSTPLISIRSAQTFRVQGRYAMTYPLVVRPLSASERSVLRHPCVADLNKPSPAGTNPSIHGHCAACAHGRVVMRCDQTKPKGSPVDVAQDVGVGIPVERRRPGHQQIHRPCRPRTSAAVVQVALRGAVVSTAETNRSVGEEAVLFEPPVPPAGYTAPLHRWPACQQKGMSLCVFEMECGTRPAMTVCARISELEAQLVHPGSSPQSAEHQ